MAGPQLSPWLKFLSPPPVPDGRQQVLCFPHSGGSAGVFRPLAAQLSGVRPVVALQYPGRQERLDEPVITDLHELADRVAAELALVPAQLPRLFVGHSMGAMLAYEVAQRLGTAGPAVLVVSGRPAPSRVRLTTSYQLDDATLADQVIRLGGPAAAVLADAEMRELLLPSIRGDYQASETYQHRGDPPLSCPVIALTGNRDPVASPGDVRAWSEHTTGPFRMAVLDGGHFFLMDHWPVLAGLIRQAALAP